MQEDRYLLSKEDLRFVLQDCLASLQDRVVEGKMCRLHKEYMSEIRATVNDLIKHSPDGVDSGLIDIQIEVINHVSE